MITEDKCRLILTEHLGKMQIRRDWIAPLGVFIAISLSLATSTFNNTVLDPPTWKALFILVAGVMLVLTIWTAYRAYLSRKGESVQAVVERLKKGTA